jgi:hypothetical protein
VLLTLLFVDELYLNSAIWSGLVRPSNGVGHDESLVVQEFGDLEYVT